MKQNHLFKGTISLTDFSQFTFTGFFRKIKVLFAELSFYILWDPSNFHFLENMYVSLSMTEVFVPVAWILLFFRVVLEEN